MSTGGVGRPGRGESGGWAEVGVGLGGWENFGGWVDEGEKGERRWSEEREARRDADGRQGGLCVEGEGVCGGAKQKKDL